MEKQSDSTPKFYMAPNTKEAREKALKGPPNFDDIKVSTKTIIAISNLTINIEKVFAYLPVTKYTIVPKKRGRKSKEEEDVEDPNKNVSSGSIITVKCREYLRGVDLKKKKSNKRSAKYFRNAITIVMVIENKMINFKVSKNGKFQLTGCKNDEHAKKCIQYTWEYIRNMKDDEPQKISKDKPLVESELIEDTPAKKRNNLADSTVQAICNGMGAPFWHESGSEDPIYTIQGDYPKVVFLTVMTNIDFNLGFFVNRENLDRYINLETDYISLLETSFGYTGVNIKIPLAKPVNLDLCHLAYKDGEWISSMVPYSEYLKILTPKEKAKEAKKERYNTFLVFHSGNVIMSGMHPTYMRDIYYHFFDIMDECRDFIEEKLEV